jgi:hypothetical protein
MRYRLTVSGSMILIVALGLSFAALREANYVLLTIVSALTIVALTLAVLAAKFGGHAVSSFGFGAALFGWVAFVLAFGPWRIAYPPNDLDKPLRDFLPTHLMVSAVAERLAPIPDVMTTTVDEQIVTDERLASAIGIGHCLLSLWLGLVGGALAIALASRRRTPRGQPSAAPEE